ncbi:ATP-binding protein [Frankia sp. R82]|uniref:sensor histidine kinase n=1 Tax=Frankia sp. R82 TaxID=2950553 RepID=UPI0020448EC4|nr:ATP-binding protein [Frankia sp. R82]
MQALSRVMVRCAIQLRVMHLAFLLSSVAVWFTWYRSHPVGAGAAGAMFAWSVLVLVLLRRQRVDGSDLDAPDRRLDGGGAADEHGSAAGPGATGEQEHSGGRGGTDDEERRGEPIRISPVLVGLDVAVAVAGAAVAPWIVPEPVRGDPASFVFVGALTAAVTAAFTMTHRVFAATVALLCAVHLATGVGHRPQIFAATLILLVVAFLLRYALARLLRVADDADLRQQRSTAHRRRTLVAEARERAAQESERLLHDTILNTLTGIGMAEDGPVDLLREQCAHSVREVEDHLGPRHDTGSRPGSGVLERLARTMTQASRTGLQITRDGAGEGTDVGWVPDEVAAAVAAATGEALRNVRAHAGTGEARVITRVEPGRLRVSILDRGRGFRPDEVAAHSARLGLRNSVSARMRAVGGEAHIWSSPGQGTEVALTWAEPPRVATHPATSAATCSSDVPESAAAVADRIEEELSATVRRAFAVAVVVGWLASLIPVIVHRDQARSVPLSLGIWLVTLAAVVTTAWIGRRRPLRPAEARGAVLLAIASAVGGALNTDDSSSEVIVCWATTMVNPLWLAFAVQSRRRRERYAAAALAALTMIALVLVLGGRQDHLVLARLGGAIYALVILQVLVTMFGPVLRASAQERARAEQLAAGVTDQRILDHALRRDREQRLAQLDTRFLPLLRDLAAGRLDPTTPDVRARCTAQARALRRELTGAGPEVLQDFAEPIEAAEARGVAVTVQADGLFTAVPAAVGAEFLARVSAVLASVGRGTVLLTGYLDTDQADVYLTYPVRAVMAPAQGGGRAATLADFGRFGEFGPAGAGLVRSRASMTDGIVCVELRWSASETSPDAPSVDGLGDQPGSPALLEPAASSAAALLASSAPVVPSAMAGMRGSVPVGDEPGSPGRGVVEQQGGGGERRAAFRRDQTDA